MIIAHRGGIPENTLLGFAGCVLNKIYALEFDVHLTSDGVFVVTHDYVINSNSVSQMTLKDIKIMNADIPALIDVLDVIREVSILHNVSVPKINIEIKPFGIFIRLAEFIKQYIGSQSKIKLSDCWEPGK